jgi:hypothetical protein
MGMPSLLTSYFRLTGINRSMFQPFCDIDSDYINSKMANKMYERFAGALLENEGNWSEEEKIEYLSLLFKDFAMYQEVGISQFILHNSSYCIGFNIDVICTDFEDIWNNTIVYVSLIQPETY